MADMVRSIWDFQLWNDGTSHSYSYKTVFFYVVLSIMSLLWFFDQFTQLPFTSSAGTSELLSLTRPLRPIITFMV
jgi:hypothetical protein